MAGRSLIVCHQGGNNVGNFSTNNTTWFWSIVQSRVNGTSSVTEAQMAVTIRRAATIRNARIRVISNTRTTNCTVRSRKNAADGNILITIGGGLTGVFEDTVNSDTVAVTDTYCFAFATLGSGGTLAMKYLIAELESDTGNAHVYVGSGDSPISFSTASSTLFNTWTGDDGGSTVDSDATTRHPIPCAGVLSNMQIAINSNARTTDTTFRSRINSANGNQTITVTAGATGLFEDTSNTDTVAEMDRCGWSCQTGTGTGSISVRRFNMMFVGTDDETPYSSHSNDNAIGAGTHFGCVSGVTEVSATESDVQIPMLFDCTIQRVGGQWGFGSGGGTIRSRINNANGNGLASTSSSGTQLVSDSSNQDSVVAGDLVNVSWTVTNTGNAHFQQFALLDEVVTPPAAVGTRATMAAGYVGVITDSEGVRATQAGGYVGVQVISEGVRATQAMGYAGRLAEAPMRATQLGGYIGVRVLVPGCLTNEAECWRIERTDGEVFTFTAHDKPIVFRGETYTPCGSLVSSALQTSAEFGATENLDLTGVIASGQITRADLWAGKYDAADIEVWRVDWSNPTVADLLAAGKAGSLEFGSNEFKFEVVTAGERLQQRPILQPVMPTCRFRLGDSRCTVDLEAARVSGSVTALATPDLRVGAAKRIFADASRTEADGYFQLGRLTWTSGANIGISVDVKLYAADTFTLERPMQYDIELGDAYTVVPGCDRIFTTCDTKFANAVNFGGFPHLRGTDDLQQTPGFKQ